VRGIINGVGTALGWLFGTASEADIKGLQEAIEQAKSLAGTAAADAARAREGVATFTKIANQRLDNMRAILEEEHQTVSAVVKNVRIV
jgi:hypothetical protein